ncbi:LysR family transcriptional regulator [Pseudomonas fluorescens]|uniref:HTH-type transcriptional regulator DmlR n=1 Tax=Pseudomonas fluorescens TaxID=294 RepID=A0A109KVS5_PSEFL|nr:LysR family transcriptional regulator [Pseudomonas fluorescens]KWV76323.1 HTH-type transcriptional regulator DmlR [Pseudomonas fluorescens]
MNLLDHMRTFVSVARLSSFSAAAQALNITLPTVSKSIVRLEGHLNAALLNRASQQIQLTPVGQDFFLRCSQIIFNIDAALSAVADSNVLPEGHIRVHATNEIGKRYLIPAIADYRRQHPRVTIDLVVEDRVPDLHSEHFDVAISLVPPGNDCLFSRNLGAMYSMLCASEEYLTRHGYPHVPADLIRHECLTPSEMPMEATDTWAFEGPYGAVNVYIPPSSLQLNSGDAIIEAICSGLGIGCVPMAQATQMIGERRLINILPDYRLVSQGIHAFYPEHLREDVCVRSWIGHLSNFLPKLLATSLQYIGDRQNYVQQGDKQRENSAATFLT